MWSFGQKEKVLLRFSVNLCFYSLPVQMLCESCYFLAFPSQKNGFLKPSICVCSFGCAGSSWLGCVRFLRLWQRGLLVGWRLLLLSVGSRARAR